MSIANLQGIKPLNFTSEEYMNAHLNFRLNITNQGDVILGILQEKIKNHIVKNELNALRLASIGSGTGVIDAPLVERLQEICPVNYLGIEPNAHQNAMARERMAAIINGNSEADFFTGLIEEFEPSLKAATFDAIIAVHVTYYSPDIAPMLRKALDMLDPGNGILLTVVSANTPQNELFMETTQAIGGYTPFLFEQYKESLNAVGVSFKAETIEAEIDISKLIENPDSPESKKFLDFFLHADSSSIPNKEKERYLGILHQSAVRQNERLILPHIAMLVKVSFSSK